MSNNKQSSIEILCQKLANKLGLSAITFYIDHQQEISEAKAMHKQEIVEGINKISKNNVKYANMIIASWSQIEGELFMHNTKLAEQYYNETYGGNNEQ